MDGPFLELCPTVALAHEDGRHSAVALLLKAALIHVSDYRLLGDAGLNKAVMIAIIQSSGTEPNSYDFFIYCCYIWSDVGSTIF